MVHRKEFRVWMETEASCLLWIDGYQVPHRPSWTTGFALNVIRAAMVNGHDTLYYFGSLHQDKMQPRALVQSLLFHLLQRFPTILSHGDPELFSAEIFLAAKSSLDLSWRIFLECLRLLPSTVVYLIVEGIDHVHMSDVGNDFQSLLTQFKSLSTSGDFEDKLVKVFLTSVRPNAGFDIVFPSHEMKVNQVDNNVLIRVPHAVSRSRKVYTKQRPRKTPSACEIPPAPDLHLPGVSNSEVPRMDDFAPSDDDRSERPTEIDSDSDFDIFSEKPRNMKQAAGGRDAIPQEIWKSENKSFGFPNSHANTLLTEDVDGSDSGSSFVIFDTQSPSAKMKLSGSQSSDFAPSDSDII
ncbi:uncharacterized protein Triagg1_9169 [Trichoderma aggressivum f. europaeum]|uniref:Nephrocystin 3-like N-terminal domain-containing protein n=1 Tax=Trichoderma aggressivum f. europaeum TaxID=173218 RepID=A0AAE1M143_9HYPO|nr:hypothetical protein Triagg1_9169 [Trichoderma aggressivum f. europaeum]